MKKNIMLLVVFFIIAVTANILAENYPADMSRPLKESEKVANIDKFITPDGRFDLEAVRASGYQGGLDIEGLDIALDPVTAEPIVRQSARLSPSDHPDDKYWDNSMSVNSIDFDWIYISALAIYNDTLIAGGRYGTEFGDGGIFLHKWTGMSWSALEDEMINEDSLSIYAITVYDDKLIVGGHFSSIGDVIMNNIAAWDGNTWSPLGKGVSDGSFMTYISALIVHDNKLIVGGNFGKAGEVTVENIAAWNGDIWLPIDSVGLSVIALTVYEQKLVAGGYSSSDSNIAILNESGWSWLAVTDDSVDGLTIYQNKLIASGRFHTLNGDSINHIAAWDGVSWLPMGSGLSGREDNLSNPALVVLNNKLYAGGDFVIAGGDSAYHIAMWDGSTWSVMGSGTSSSVYDLTIYENKLVVGGEFIIAGDKVSPGIATWTKCCYGTTGNADCSVSEDPDISDIATIIDHLYLSHKPLCCPEEADTDGSGGDPDISDITRIIDFLYLSHTPLAECP